jgi:hypothetical protein
MLLNPFPLDASKFTVKWAAQQMFADASDLGIRPGIVPAGQLYDDACDEGITLSNPRSRVMTHWYRSTDMLERGGDIGGWTFKPCPETLRTHPHLSGWEVHINND